MRLGYKPWAMGELEDNELIHFSPTENKGSWRKIFHNDNPIYLEIGAGRGRFTRISAELNPDINYIALEMEAGAFVYAGRLFLESGLKNIQGIKAKAEEIPEIFVEDEVDRIYINFCNPWPKNRQHKRRLTHPRHLDLYKRILKAGGLVILKTDDRDFFEDSIKYFEKSGFTCFDIDYNLPADARDNIVTEYETRWRSQGVNICELKARNEK